MSTAIKEEIRSKIVGLEGVMREMPQLAIPIKHHFAPGIYLREMHMPKGSIVVGKIHKTEHLCILSKGTVVVVDEDGRRTLTAPAVIHAMPGVKRALHALEDVVWTNHHHNPNDERDENKIDDIFVVDTFEQFLSFMEAKCLS
jgi:hypothetical protein